MVREIIITIRRRMCYRVQNVLRSFQVYMDKLNNKCKGICFELTGYMYDTRKGSFDKKESPVNGFGRQIVRINLQPRRSNVQLCRNERFRASPLKLRAVLQLEQHEPLAGVDDSATLIVVPCIERPLADADSCAASAFLLTVW